MHPQLPLNIRLDQEATFANYFAEAGSQNARVVAALTALASSSPQSVAPERFLYVWGAGQTGRSHLLQATIQSATLAGRRCQFLPLRELKDVAPTGVLDNLEHVELVCLDDLDAVLGNAAWEEQVFHLFNNLRQQGHCLLVSANAAPRDLAVNLPDLASRLAWGTVYRLDSLDDETRKRALQWRARARGLDMSDEVAHFILRRFSRDARSLFDCLDQLDRASLAEKRRLTIPFVKDALMLVS